MPNYPAQIDTPQSLPTAVDNLTPVYGAIFNRLRDAVIAIEAELGVKPSGQYGNVGARLITLENVVGNLKIIELEGDLGGTLESPRVIGIQGYPVSPAAPQFNQVMVWDGIAWTPQNQSGGGGGGFNPPAGTSPGQTLIWTGSGYAPEFYETDDLIPPLQVLLTGTTLAEVNQTLLHPAFTAAYSETPTSALLKDSDNNTNQSVVSTPTSFSSVYSFTKTAFGDTVTFTLTATEGHNTKTSQVVTTWAQKLYWGTGTAGQTGASFITGLVGSAITTDKLFSFNIIPGSTEKIYFACRSAYGAVIFTVDGIQGGFTKTQTVAVTNGFGFTENYDLYESDQVNLGNVFVFTGNGNDEFALPGGPVGPPGPQGPPGQGGGSGPGGLIVDADVAPAAAIQGTKISPNFGNQVVSSKTNMLATAYDLYPIRVPNDANTTIAWTFDETTLPYHNSGVGGAQNLTYSPFNPLDVVDGLFVNAFNLAGNVVTSPSTPVDIGTTACTLSAWILPATLVAGPIIAKNWNAGNNHNVPFDAISLNMGNNDGSVVFRITTADTHTNTDLTSPPSAVTTGNWHHIGVTWDGYNMKGYIDGNLAAHTVIGTGSTNLDYGSDGTWFMGALAGGDGAVNLIVDDVRAENIARPAQYFLDVYNSAIYPQLATSTRPGEIVLAGDISGDALFPTVSRLQGNPVYKDIPQDGYVLTWDATDGYWIDKPAPAATGSSIDFNNAGSTGLFEIGGSLYVVAPGDPNTPHPSFNITGIGSNVNPPPYFQFSGAGVSGVMGRGDRVVISGNSGTSTPFYNCTDIGFGWVADITVLYGALEQQGQLFAAFKYIIYTYNEGIVGNTSPTWSFNPGSLFTPPTFTFVGTTLSISSGQSPWAAIGDFSVISINGGI